MAVKVAVVGAGAVGLMAMKNFSEDGFDVTGFETRAYVGGLWKNDSRNHDDNSLSVFSTTKFNSSRYRSAISDFPFPEETDDYPTAPQMHHYLVSYAEHFGLMDKIHFNTRVLGLERENDRWAITVQSANEPARIEYFDKVAISTGSFSTPKKIQFDGIERFAGPVIHAIDYHNPERFKNHNVLIIGVHASAQDVVTSLKDTATKVYMSHRHGLLLLPRYTNDGTVGDASATLKLLLIQTFMSTWFPRLWDWLIDKLLMSMSAKAFKIKPEWNFSPAPSMAIATPLMADELYTHLQSGFATPVHGVRAITGPRSVVLTDGTELHEIDSIIQCTGYEFAVPCLPQTSPYQPFPTPGEAPYLYRNIFPLHPDAQVRNSLAFLGQSAIAFPGFVMPEMTAQAISQIWLGRRPLPPLAQMKSWHASNQSWREQQKKLHGPSSTFYVGFVPFAEHIRWIDETAGAGVFLHFDWAWFNWRSWRLWWVDRELYNTCLGGLFSPAVWRLFDCGGRKCWGRARRQVLIDDWMAIGRKKADGDGNGEVKKRI